MGRPCKNISPPAGSYKRKIKFNKVVFPEPVPPMTATVSPCLTVKLMSDRAAVGGLY
jgi:hypothetical protein